MSITTVVSSVATNGTRSTSSETPAIRTRSLRKEFGAKVAVADLTLEVQAGEVFGFLGPNGAGKTTSVKMLLGLTHPTAGEGWLLGEPLGHLPTRKRVGFLPEHFRFYEWLKGSEFLDLHGRLFGMSATARRAAIPDLLKLVGLSQRGETPLGAFSKGMLQRIGLAQALLNNPRVVFLDEPTSGLDPIGRRLVRDIINGLRSEGTAVFLNSHLLGEVEKTCDRVAFIRDGSVIEVHSLDDLAQREIHLTIRVGQPTPDLLANLATFGPTSALDGNGCVEVEVPGEAHLPAIARWLVENDYTLYEFSPRRLSLEERFVQVVGNVTGDQ